MSYETGSADFLNTLETVSSGGTATEALVSYLGAQPAPHQDRLMQAWDDMRQRSTPAFWGDYQAARGVPIPTSFQENKYIGHALRLYKDQLNPARPMRIISYLNWPDGASRHEISRTRNELSRFIDDHPSIPFAFFENIEEEPIAIGGIRKLATDASLPFLDPYAMIANRDADERGTSFNHFDVLEDYYYRPSRRPAAAVPTVLHEAVPNLPYINRLIRWFDDPEVLELTGEYYEPGPVIRADDYIAVGGYNRRRTLSETHDLIDNITHLEYPPRIDIIRAPAHITLSPRRLVEKLSTFEDLGHIWTTENFIADDTYRSSDPDFGRYTDLPEHIANYRLQAYGRTILTAARRVHSRSFGLRPAPGALEQRLEAIRLRLGGPDDMFAPEPW